MERIFNFLDGIGTAKAEELTKDGYVFRMEDGHVQAMAKEDGMTTWWACGWFEDGTQFGITIDAAGEFDMFDRLRKIYPDYDDLADYDDYGVLIDRDGLEVNMLRCEFAERLEV